MRLAILITLPLFAINAFASTNTAYTADTVFSFKRIAQVVPSPDGKRVAFLTYQVKSTPTGKQWEYSLNLKDQKGKSRLLTKGNKISSVNWLNDGKQISYLAKGTQFQSIWILDYQQNNARKLFEFTTDIESFKWSPNNKYIAFSATGALGKSTSPTAIDVKNDFTNTRLYFTPIHTTKMVAQALTSADYSTSPSFDWAPDNQSIVFAHQPQPGERYSLKNIITIINLKTREFKNIPYSENHNSTQPTYSLDGKWIAFQASPSQEEIIKKLNHTQPDKPSPLLAASWLVTKICATNTSSLETHCLANTPNENPTILGWNATSDSVLALDAFKTTGYQIYSLSLNNTKSVTNLSNVDGFIEPFTITLNNPHTLFGFGYETTMDAPQAYVSPVSPFKLEKISPATTHPILGKAQTLHWKSKDGMEIEGLLVTPGNYDSTKKYPLLITVHGGPAGAWAKRYLGGCDEYEEMIDPTTCWGTFLNLGFVIFEPNPRGSTGYGSKFRLENIADFGGNDYQDVITGIDYLIQNGIAKPDHLAIAGWSYGGYLTTWAISHSNRFKAAIDGDGNTDWISFAGTSSLLLFAPSFFGGSFWDNTQLYLDRSPINYVKNITTPLLIIHGEIDKRVPPTQAYELYNALQLQNKPVKMLLLPNQDHVPTDPNMIDTAINEVDRWLKQAL